MKRLGVDVDGVVANFSGKFVELANRRFGTNFTCLDQHDWDFKPWFTPAQVSEVWERDIKPARDFWQSLRPLEGTNRLRLLSKDIEPVFITSRIPTLGHSPREQTCAWLRSNFWISHPFVVVVENPSKKVSIVQALEIDNFIDDKPATVREMHTAGVRTYAKLTSYNSREPFSEGVIPVETLDEYLELEVKHDRD